MAKQIKTIVKLQIKAGQALHQILSLFVSITNKFYKCQRKLKQL